MRAIRVAQLIAALLFVALLAGCFRAPKPEPKAVAVVAAVLDLSPSMTDDRRCDELAARVRVMLASPGVRRFDVMALGTGEVASGFEPLILVPWTRFEPSGALYEDPGRMESARGAWVESVRARCRESVRTTNTSPIYAAIRRASESVRAHCAEIEGRRERCERRFLYVHSDLRENGERTIAEHLAARSRGRPAPTSALPRIDSSGVELVVCGVSNTRVGPGEGYVAPDALLAVWGQVFGPNVGAFDAACPVDSAPVTDGGRP